MSTHVIIGRGATATATARLLADAGNRVRMISRSGTGPQHPGIEPVKLDATDTKALTAALRGADTVFNTAATAYHTWPQTMPSLYGSILTAVKHVNAGYVMLGNLYGYGPFDGTITGDTPLGATDAKGLVRAQLWREAKAVHDAGDIRVTELRAGQFLGDEAISIFNFLVRPKVLAEQLALVPQELDLPHPYSVIDDVAAALVAVAGGDTAWGRAWHAPIITTTVRDLATRLAEQAGVDKPRLEVMSDRDLTLLGLTDPFWNELLDTYHMSHRPFTVDDSEIADHFGISATPLDRLRL